MNNRKKIIKYKLVDQDGYTRRGQSGETYWLDRKQKMAYGGENNLCSKDVIHYYSHPLLAVLFNPIHANIATPRLIRLAIDSECAHDGFKGGCKKAIFISEIKLPIISINQKVAFSITIALKYYKDEEYKKWAINWLYGKNRSEAVAWSAAAKAWSAEVKARSAEVKARSAEVKARSAAAEAAARSAEAAARSAEAAAWSVAARSATAIATSAAAWSAAAAAEAWSVAARSATAEEINKLFIRTIRKIIKDGQK